MLGLLRLDGERLREIEAGVEAEVEVGAVAAARSEQSGTSLSRKLAEELEAAAGRGGAEAGMPAPAAVSWRGEPSPMAATPSSSRAWSCNTPSALAAAEAIAPAYMPPVQMLEGQRASWRLGPPPH